MITGLTAEAHLLKATEWLGSIVDIQRAEMSHQQPEFVSTVLPVDRSRKYFHWV